MDTITLTLPETTGLNPGQRILLAPCTLEFAGLPWAKAELPHAARVGDTLADDSGAALRLSGFLNWGMSDCAPSVPCAMADVLRPLAPGEKLSLIRRREGFSLAWITMSDKGSVGLREDTAGPLAAQLVGVRLELNHCAGFILPDEEPRLRALLVELALVQGMDLIVTSGGTGVSPRDITPEATLAVIDKRLAGFERAMTAVSLEKTPHAVISRAVVGTLGQSLIINLPGSPKGVRECLEPILPAVKHTLEKLAGDPSDCAGQNL